MTRRSNPLGIPDHQPTSRLLGGVCQDCQQRITFVHMPATGRRVPVDPIPDDEGNVCARVATNARNTASAPTLVGYVISAERPATEGYTRFAAHFGTCPDRPRPGRTRNKRGPAAVPPALFDTPN